MKCFYHKTDLDGHCSGAIVKRKYPECEMIGVDYVDQGTLHKPDWGIKENETVFVVDFSFNRDEMIWLNSFTKLNWIDHHKSAIEKMIDLPFPIKGVQEIGKAGCELTWEFLFDEDVPLPVWLLGRYDVWDHKDYRVLDFQYGMRIVKNTLPDSDVWEDVFENSSTVDIFIENGSSILMYEESQNKKYAESMCFETTFQGLRAIVVNKPFSNSKVFDSVYNESKHDIMIIFGYKPLMFKYSLYSTKDDVDCSEIATSFGGGGHKGAAGFYSERLLF